MEKQTANAAKRALDEYKAEISKEISVNGQVRKKFKNVNKGTFEKNL